jgi:drug/metabolite transporter (DMT)-like permease
MEPVAPDEHPRAATLAACVAVTVFGLGNAFNKKVGTSGVTLAFWRSWLGVPVMVAILVASGGRPSRRMFRYGLEAGISFGVQICLMFTAIHNTSVTNATAISALQPVLVMAAAWRWWGERYDRWEVGLAVVALGGVLATVAAARGPIGGSLDGDLLAFGALILWSHYFFAVKRARQHLSPFELMAAVLTVSSVVITPYALLSGTDVGAMEPADWFWCSMIVLVPGAIGHLLISWSARWLPVSRSSQLTLAVPVVAVVAAAVLVGEHVTVGQVLGIGFTLASLALLLGAHAPGAEADVAAEPPATASHQEVAELPGITPVRDAVVPADERVHP